MQFIPNSFEQSLIQIIQKYSRNEFALIRMTHTMLKKSIIDASSTIKALLENECDINYDNIERGDKKYEQVFIISPRGALHPKASFYHPNAKANREMGDPRFWIYGLKGLCEKNDLIYFTSYENKFVAIVLTQYSEFENNIIDLFGTNNTDDLLLNELLTKVSKLKNIGWVESVAPDRTYANKLKSAPKDAGDTFERRLGISPNSFAAADYSGEIELKTKRVRAKNNDTLFSKVPDYSISRIKSSNEMILSYGYPARKEKYHGFIDLYVTVKNTPNNQGLYLLADDDQEILVQYHSQNGTVTDTALWRYDELRDKLYQKHKKTLWVNVDEKIINGKIHFKYLSAELTQRPIFSQFTSLINQGIITYDWRGRVMEDGTKYKDKGHAFRMSNKNRNLLFGETRTIDFTKY